MKRINFGIKSYSRTVLKNNIVRMYDISSEEDRHDWYSFAHGYAKGLSSAHYGITLNQAIGVIAALSPRMRWDKNKEAAFKLISSGDCKAMGVFKKKGLDILALDEPSDEAVLGILNGMKIQNFYLAIKYPEDTSNIVVDRHALSVALGYWIDEKTHGQLTPIKYQFVAEAYSLAAHQVGISPVLMQSTTWMAFRKIKENYKLK